MRNPIARAFIILAVIAGLALPATRVQASPQFGYEINYYRWQSGYGYGVIGSEWLYCFMVRPAESGDVTTHYCLDIKEVIDFDCDNDTMSTSYYYHDGMNWVPYYGQQMWCIA